ncbi:hypothetical protein FrCorBMG51_00835 [Protofrankia coriariae]|uniref:Chromosomal replication initiator protein n=1 Tax=Protofrankia coriariae TaxID=1562887 RepID=A0ABR5F8N9_9ACTN|nr:hypothetical protein FrCorBMG51_00835 [Protofrankia coriariae]
MSIRWKMRDSALWPMRRTARGVSSSLPALRVRKPWRSSSFSICWRVRRSSTASRPSARATASGSTSSRDAPG